MNSLISTISDLIFWLEGKKTNLIAAAATLLNLVVVLYPNLLSAQQLLKIDAVLVALGGAALHAAIVRE